MPKGSVWPEGHKLAGKPCHQIPGPDIHGTLAQCWPAIVEWNRKGYEIYFMLNAGNGKGTQDANVTAIRGVFADIEPPHNSDPTATVRDILAGPADARPDMVVLTSAWPVRRY